MTPPTLSDLLGVLEILAPPELAAPWDNTGLLVEGDPGPIDSILLTLDLTPAVAAEALRTRARAVIAYHPPIFDGLKRLDRADRLTAALLDLHRAGVSVYSPHTALDAAPGGIADWLATALAPLESLPLEGSGRLLQLPRAMTLRAVGDAFAAHLTLPYLRVARSAHGPTRIRRIALCPGSGGSLLREVDADLVFTGELKHHDLLAFNRRGVHAIISEHGHTERPYLSELRKRLLTLLPNLGTIRLARADREPVELRLPSRR